MTTSRWQSRLTTFVNIGVVILAVVLLGGGPVRKRVSEMRRNAVQRDAIKAVWPELSSGPRTHTNGDKRAIIVELGDYQCPSCQISHKIVGRLAEALEIDVVYRHLPIPSIHNLAEAAASASICAEAQGEFLAMHNYLYENDDWKREPVWTIVASRAGIPDTLALRNCMTSDQTAKRLGARPVPG